MNGPNALSLEPWLWRQTGLIFSASPALSWLWNLEKKFLLTQPQFSHLENGLKINPHGVVVMLK